MDSVSQLQLGGYSNRASYYLAAVAARSSKAVTATL